jgi:Domain of unknown function (DUF4389)
MSAAEQPGTSLAVPDPSGPPSPNHPARFEIGYPSELNRWLPLVKWLLAIPHYFVLIALGLAAAVVVVIAFFSILFTTRYPRGMFDFFVGVSRWGNRVLAYTTFMRDEYPPFSLK